uniref:Gla domain-containing protein n=1 Tax=Eptatretus burgeri TaxID=7764 RepID=A0A8C4NKP6_EPTBU
NIILLQREQASSFLSRSRRANSFLNLLEESWEGNLENECIEEDCDWEEAREIFENKPETAYLPHKCNNMYLLSSLKSETTQTIPMKLDDNFHHPCYTKYQYLTEKRKGQKSFHQNKTNMILLFASCSFFFTTLFIFPLLSQDIDECAMGICSNYCLNFPGSFTCICDGRNYSRLSSNGRACQSLRPCRQHSDQRNHHVFYLGSNFNKQPVAHLRFQLNPRLDGCLRNWNWLDQDTSWISDEVRMDPEKQCLDTTESGTYFPGQGYTRFDYLPYQSRMENDWHVHLSVRFRAATDIGVIFAVFGNSSTPKLSLALSEHSTLDGIEQVWKMNSLCFSYLIKLRKTLYFNSKIILLPILCYFSFTQHLPSLPTLHSQDFVPVTATPVSASFHGCLQDLKFGSHFLDVDNAQFKHHNILSHSCPPLENV